MINEIETLLSDFSNSNTEALTIHIISLGKLLKDFNMVSKILFNLYETEMATKRD